MRDGIVPRQLNLWWVGWKGIQRMITEKDGYKLVRIISLVYSGPSCTDSLPQFMFQEDTLPKEGSDFYTLYKPSTEDLPGHTYKVWQCFVFNYLIKLPYDRGKLLITGK